MPPIVRRPRRPLIALCVFTLSTFVALTGCTSTSSGDGQSVPSAPGAGPSSAVPATRQQAIARARDLTLRVEVTTCNEYQTGTGFVVGPRLIATAAHVLRGAQTIAVRGLHDQASGTIIGTDTARDVALIRTSTDIGVGDPLVFAADEPQQGDEIVAIGYPEGRPQTPTTGTVSRLGQSVDVDDRRLRDLVQFDAESSPGSSGGPLLDLRGEVVGMTALPDDYLAGQNYAVSSRTAQPLVTAWTDSPAEVNPTHCPHRSTVVSNRSGSADGPGIAFAMRQYFDILNTASKTRQTDPDTSYGQYQDAYDTASGRLQKKYGSLDEFRGERLDLRYSKVHLASVRRVDEVTDSADVDYRRTLLDGKNSCTRYHYRYQVRLASGSWKLDDRKSLAGDGRRC